ncbi:MAG: hypothetical protein V9G24_16415 [Rhodoblastus sp.]
MSMKQAWSLMLHLQFLGTFHVTFAHGREASIDTARGKALLAYLVIENDRAHLREQLATMFWPEADQKSAMQSLRQALYKLKRALAAGARLAPRPRTRPTSPSRAKRRLQF